MLIPTTTPVLTATLTAGAQVREASDKARNATVFLIGAGIVAFWLLRRWARS